MLINKYQSSRPRVRTFQWLSIAVAMGLNYHVTLSGIAVTWEVRWAILKLPPRKATEEPPYLRALKLSDFLDPLNFYMDLQSDTVMGITHGKCDGPEPDPDMFLLQLKFHLFVYVSLFGVMFQREPRHTGTQCIPTSARGFWACPLWRRRLRRRRASSNASACC